MNYDIKTVVLADLAGGTTTATLPGSFAFMTKVQHKATGAVLGTDLTIVASAPAAGQAALVSNGTVLELGTATATGDVVTVAAIPVGAMPQV